jgi:hypothetical protein
VHGATESVAPGAARVLLPCNAIWCPYVIDANSMAPGPAARAAAEENWASTLPLASGFHALGCLPGPAWQRRPRQASPFFVDVRLPRRAKPAAVRHMQSNAWAASRAMWRPHPHPPPPPPTPRLLLVPGLRQMGTARGGLSWQLACALLLHHPHACALGLGGSGQPGGAQRPSIVFRMAPCQRAERYVHGPAAGPRMATRSSL